MMEGEFNGAKVAYWSEGEDGNGEAKHRMCLVKCGGVNHVVPSLCPTCADTGYLIVDLTAQACWPLRVMGWDDPDPGEVAPDAQFSRSV